MRSHMIPSWGTSYFLSIILISSIVFIAGESPPWTQNNELSIKAPKANKSKISVQYLQTFKLPNFLRHSS